MIVCQECGNAAPSADGFCSSCGVLLEWSGQPVETPPAPPLVPAAQVAVLEVRPDSEAVRPAPVPLTADDRLDGLFCSSCGTRNADGRSFCRRCGTALDRAVTVPARLRWWQRVFRRSPKVVRAGDRPRRFRRQGAESAPTTERHRPRLPSRLPLSRVAPILVVLGLVGIGIGPARQWLTQRADGVLGQAADHVHRSYEPVTPLSASATSSAKGHRAQAAIDGVRDTWWQSAGHTGGIGEAVTVRFADPTDIDAIGVLSGVSGDKYRALARPGTLTLTVDGRPSGQVTFADKADFQTAQVHLKQVTTLTVVVTASFPGQRGSAVAIRELQFSQLR